VRLRILKLNNNGINDAITEIIQKGLQFNETITQLDLSQNRIGTRGAAMLGDLSEVTVPLRILDLSWNPL